MRWLTFLPFAVVGILMLSPPVILATTSTGVAIESISHKVGSETEEKLLFKLSRQATPRIFTIKGESPRLVVDFPDCSYKGKGTIPLVEGRLATTIRTGIHQTPEQKIRVVIDLAKEFPVRFTSEYSEADNNLTVTLLSDSQKDVFNQAAAASAVKQGPAVLPQQPTEVVLAKPVAEKAVTPPIFPPAEPVKKDAASISEIGTPSPGPPVEASAVAPVASPAPPAKVDKPQILKVSFDDSSNKGEMVLFHLTSFHPPTVSAVEKDNPRVLCDFVGMELDKGVEETITAKGKYVESINTSKLSTPDKVRVVLNLIPNRDYDLQQVFFKNDNLFVLIVNELPPEKTVQ